jgi:hypothetical protein
VLIGRAPCQPSDELDIDFQIVDGQLLYMGERPIARPEVIEGIAATEVNDTSRTSGLNANRWMDEPALLTKRHEWGKQEGKH